MGMLNALLSALIHGGSTELIFALQVLHSKNLHLYVVLSGILHSLHYADILIAVSNNNKWLAGTLSFLLFVRSGKSLSTKEVLC